MKNVFVELKGNDDEIVPECTCPVTMMRLANRPIFLDDDDDHLNDGYDRQREVSDACRDLMKDDAIKKLITKVLSDDADPCFRTAVRGMNRFGPAKNMATQTEDMTKDTDGEAAEKTEEVAKKTEAVAEKTEAVDEKAEVLAEKTEPDLQEPALKEGEAKDVLESAE